MNRERSYKEERTHLKTRNKDYGVKTMEERLKKSKTTYNENVVEKNS